MKNTIQHIFLIFVLSLVTFSLPQNISAQQSCEDEDYQPGEGAPSPGIESLFISYALNNSLGCPDSYVYNWGSPPNTPANTDLTGYPTQSFPNNGNRTLLVYYDQTIQIFEVSGDLLEPYEANDGPNAWFENPIRPEAIDIRPGYYDFADGSKVWEFEKGFIGNHVNDGWSAHTYYPAVCDITVHYDVLATQTYSAPLLRFEIGNYYLAPGYEENSDGGILEVQGQATIYPEGLSGGLVVPISGVVEIQSNTGTATVEIPTETFLFPQYDPTPNDGIPHHEWPTEVSYSVWLTNNLQNKTGYFPTNYPDAGILAQLVDFTAYENDYEMGDSWICAEGGAPGGVFTPRPPIAEAGPSLIVYYMGGDPANASANTYTFPLDGSGSYDPDGGDIIEYNWTVLNFPPHAIMAGLVQNDSGYYEFSSASPTLEDHPVFGNRRMNGADVGVWEFCLFVIDDENEQSENGESCFDDVVGDRITVIVKPLDTDGDSLTDADEKRDGSPINWRDADRDDDGLYDGEEYIVITSQSEHMSGFWGSRALGGTRTFQNSFYDEYNFSSRLCDPFNNGNQSLGFIRPYGISGIVNNNGVYDGSVSWFNFRGPELTDTLRFEADTPTLPGAFYDCRGIQSPTSQSVQMLVTFSDLDPYTDYITTSSPKLQLQLLPDLELGTYPLIPTFDGGLVVQLLGYRDANLNPTNPNTPLRIPYAEEQHIARENLLFPSLTSLGFEVGIPETPLAIGATSGRNGTAEFNLLGLKAGFQFENGEGDLIGQRDADGTIYFEQIRGERLTDGWSTSRAFNLWERINFSGSSENVPLIAEFELAFYGTINWQDGENGPIIQSQTVHHRINFMITNRDRYNGQVQCMLPYNSNCIPTVQVLGYPSQQLIITSVDTMPVETLSVLGIPEFENIMVGLDQPIEQRGVENNSPTRLRVNDVSEFDTDGDGQANEIRISANTNRSIATGNYTAIIYFDNQDGVLFRMDSAIPVANPTQQVEIILSSLDLYQTLDESSEYDLVYIGLVSMDSLVAETNGNIRAESIMLASFDPPPIEITQEPYLEYLDTNQNGLIDQANIIIEVSSDQNGDFSLQTSLFADGSTLDIINSVQNFVIGSNHVVLPLSMNTIRSIADSEETHLSGLRFEGITDSLTINHDYILQVDIEQADIELPAVYNPTNFIDYGVDATDDGYFDFLNVEFDIYANVHGYYDLEVTLSSSPSQPIRVFWMQLELLQGENHITIPFDSEAIGQSGATSPFLVERVRIVNSDDLSDVLDVWDAHWTNEYENTQFLNGIPNLIDDQAPNIQVWFSGNPVTRVETQSVFWIVTDLPASNGAVSGVYSIEAYLNGESIENGQLIDTFWWDLGIHTLTLTATDRAGNSRTVEVSFELVATLESLRTTVLRLCYQDEIESNSLETGICNSLATKIDNAIFHRDEGRADVTINMLNAFRNEIFAQEDNKISVLVGDGHTNSAFDLLDMDSQYLIDLYGTPDI